MDVVSFLLCLVGIVIALVVMTSSYWKFGLLLGFVALLIYAIARDCLCKRSGGGNGTSEEETRVKFAEAHETVKIDHRLDVKDQASMTSETFATHLATCNNH